MSLPLSSSTLWCVAGLLLLGMALTFGGVLVAGGSGEGGATVTVEPFVPLSGVNPKLMALSTDAVALEAESVAVSDAVADEDVRPLASVRMVREGDRRVYRIRATGAGDELVVDADSGRLLAVLPSAPATAVP